MPNPTTPTVPATSNLTLITSGGPTVRTKADYNRARRRAIAYGRWTPYTNAEPARRHITTYLTAGVTPHTLALLSGEDRKTITRLIHGEPTTGRAPSRRIRQSTADALLAVTVPVDQIRLGALVTSIGSRRRVQALATLGWPRPHIAATAGIADSVVDYLLVRPWVRASTAVAITGAYDRLWDLVPEQHGVRLRDARRIRRLAQQAGWARPMEWDDDRIDDPAAWPDRTGWCGRPGGAHAHARAGTPPCEACLTVPFGVECGTRRGYDEHRELGTTTCPTCRAAVNTGARERKARRRARQQAAA